MNTRELSKTVHYIPGKVAYALKAFNVKNQPLYSE